MENEEMKTKLSWGVVIAKGVAAGIVCCAWWFSARLYALPIDRGHRFWLFTCAITLLTAMLLCIKGFRGWWISSGIAAVMLWSCIYLYPSFALRFLDKTINARHIYASSLYSYILIFFDKDINTESLYYTYQSVYFILFFSFTWILLFLIWLAWEIHMVRFQENDIK